MKPLPRSLSPLVGESLPGFMLRLSHRLDLPPTYLDRLTGLSSPNTHAPSWLNISIPAPIQERFASATRLTLAETQQLALQSIAGNYPPITTPAAGTSRAREAVAIAAQELWLFGKSTQYCPQCLAGDGSPIQQGHGGPWKVYWRLPIIFACLRHQRLLEHLCPQCLTPALAHRSFLIPEPSLILHPAQCRARLHTGALCQARLDQARVQARISSQTIALQHKLAACLAAQGPQATAAANAYLTDLRIIAWLISGSWPAAADLCPRTELSPALGTYLRQRQNAIRERRQHKTRPAAFALYDHAPASAAACAALLAMADHLYSHREQLAPQLRRLAVDTNFSSGWAARLRTISTPLGATIPKILEPILPKRRRQRRTKQTTRLRSRHIPQLLPIAWTRQHLPRFDSTDPLLRRLAAMKLSVHADGHSHDTAARCLGIPLSKSAPLFRDFGKWPAERQRVFDTGIGHLAEHLDGMPLLTDYEKRRHALANWSIPAHDWKRIAPATLRITPTHRILATWIIWIDITQGDRCLAPCLPPKGAKERNILHHQLRNAIRPHHPDGRSAYITIGTRTLAYAQTLATAIDQATPGQLTSKMAN